MNGGTDYAAAIEKVAQLVEAKRQAQEDARAIKFVSPPQEPLRYGVHDIKTGQIEWRPVPAAPRAYKAASLAAIVAMAEKFSGDGTGPAIFVSIDRVTFFLDETTRRERVDFDMNVSETWTRMRGEFNPGDDAADVGMWLKQREMIDLLRLELDAAIDPPNLVASLRRVRVTSNADGESSISNSKESIGRSMMAELTATDALPEDVKLRTAVHDNVLLDGSRFCVDVACDFAVKPAEQLFRIRPKAGQVAAAEVATVSWIASSLRAQLKAAGSVYCPVFEGQAS